MEQPTVLTDQRECCGRPHSCRSWKAQISKGMLLACAQQRRVQASHREALQYFITAPASPGSRVI